MQRGYMLTTEIVNLNHKKIDSEHTQTENKHENNVDVDDIKSS